MIEEYFNKGNNEIDLNKKIKYLAVKKARGILLIILGTILVSYSFMIFDLTTKKIFSKSTIWIIFTWNLQCKNNQSRKLKAPRNLSFIQDIIKLKFYMLIKNNTLKNISFLYIWTNKL